METRRHMTSDQDILFFPFVWNEHQFKQLAHSADFINYQKIDIGISVLQPLD